jgi:drug/metabolite transporter (DMT)-like permease
VTRRGHPGAAKLCLLTGAALAGFAANSLLCRLALGSGSIDAATFTAVRLGSGAVALVVLAAAARRGSAWRALGSWVSAVALFAYAITFSFAYLRLSAGTGALLLFGAVQVTMIGAGLRRGERPPKLEWLGLVVAFGGLVVLTFPGQSAPDPIGAALMLAAGVAWGVYSLRGRGTVDPLSATAGHFVRTLPLAAAAVGLMSVGQEPHASSRGLLLAVASGSLASGIGYSLWYAALPSLTATSAAVLQLAVPVLAAVGGVVLLGETMTLRAWLSGAAIVAGILIAILAAKRRRARPVIQVTAAAR